MLKILTKPLALTALIASGVAGLSAHADGISFMVVDGHANVASLSAAPAAVTMHRYAPTLGTPVTATALIDLDCSVAGTPVEFPNDIKIWSSSAVSAGTLVAWNVPGSTFDGVIELPALAANQAAFLSNVLPGGLPAGSPCEAATQ